MPLQGAAAKSEDPPPAWYLGFWFSVIWKKPLSLLLGLHLFLPPFFFRFLSLLDFNFDEFEALGLSGKLWSSDAAAPETASSPSSEACAKQ